MIFLPSAISRNKFCDLPPSSLMVTPVWTFPQNVGMSAIKKAAAYCAAAFWL